MKKYSHEEKKSILKQYDQLIKNNKKDDVLKQLKISSATIYNWRSNLKKSKLNIVSYEARPKKYKKRDAKAEIQAVKRIALIMGTTQDIVAILKGVA